MVKVRKTGEGYYLATPISNDGVLSRTECSMLRRELAMVIKSHREVSIDVRGIKSVNKEGLKILQEMKSIADQKRCKLKYINVDPLVQPQLTRLSKRKAALKDEF